MNDLSVTIISEHSVDAVEAIPVSIRPARVLDTLDDISNADTGQVAVNAVLPLRILIYQPKQNGEITLDYVDSQTGILGTPKAASPNVTIVNGGWPFILRYTAPTMPSSSDIIHIRIPVANVEAGKKIRLFASKEGATPDAAITLITATSGPAVDQGAPFAAEAAIEVGFVG